MICPKCGKETLDGMRFCQYCRANIAGAPQTPVNQQPQQMRPVSQPNQYINNGQQGYQQGYQQSYQQSAQQQGYQQSAQQQGYQQRYQQAPVSYNPYPGNYSPAGYYQAPPKKNTGKIIAAIIAVVLVFVIFGHAISSNINRGNNAVNTAQNSNSDNNNSNNSSGGTTDDVDWIDTSGADDSFTILVYMVGSNLETNSGAATRDLMEMAEARWGEDINVIIETGGAKEWANNVVSSQYLQRYEMRDGDLISLENCALEQMSTQSALSDFISFGVENYPAKRFGLVLWNHGGGFLFGYGSDELFDMNAMMISDVAEAIKTSGAHMEFVGFDACMMATFENAYALKDCANFLIASEESESNIGWYYTDWLDGLGDDPNMDTESLGRMIVDGMIARNQEKDAENEDENNQFEQYVYEQYGVEINYGKSATQSMIDLSKMDDVYDAWLTYILSLKDDLNNGGFADQSKARVEARGYGDIKDVDPATGTVSERHYDMVDMLDFIDKTHLTGSFDLENTIRDCIAYENSEIPGSNGLSVYLPYYMIDYYQPIGVPELQAIGFDDDYLSYLDLFCSYIASGNDSIQYQSSTGGNVEAPSNVTIPDYIEFEEEGGEYVLPLSADQINAIASISIEGGYAIPEYTDGSGNSHYTVLSWGENLTRISLNSNNHIVANWDGVLSGLMSVDYGQSAVPYRVVVDSEYSDDGSTYSLQMIPAILNGTYSIYIVVENTYYSVNNYESNVLGYMLSDQNEAGNRSLYAFQEGDDIVMYYYAHYLDDSDPAQIHQLSDYYYEVTVGPSGLQGCFDTISDEHKGTQENCYRYRITDIYGNDHYSEWVFY